MAKSKTGVRNKFEAAVAKQFPDFAYEAVSLPYVIEASYTPDFVDEARKIMVESKGYIDAMGRRRMICIRKQYPDWRIIFVFQNPNKRLTKAPKSLTYEQWALKNGFEVQKLGEQNEPTS